MSERSAWRIDLRSDTVTKPTPRMREAMARAEVGDDVFGDDPTVQRLEAMAAALMGKAAALFLPSGTMSNLTAVMAHCGRGDEVIIGKRAHTFLYEAGGIAALGGVHPHPLDNRPDGTMDLAAIAAAFRDADDVHQPVTRLVCLENTHNSCGGVPLTAAYTQAVGELARRRGVFLHIDGARIFDAAAALGVPPKTLAEPADSLTFCLSKGLAAPAGAILVGDAAFIARARRIRKQLGGGMRQVGVLAAPGIVALETMVDRIRNDHRRAGALAAGLNTIERIVVDPEIPPTNMVFIRLREGDPADLSGIRAALEGEGIGVSAAGSDRLRMVAHHGIGDADVDETIAAFRRILKTV